MVRVLTPEQIEEKRRAIFDTLTDPTTSHEQKVTYLARKAEDMLTVLDEPEELDVAMADMMDITKIRPSTATADILGEG